MLNPERTYLSTFFDNRRWDRFELREDDIIVATPYKAGTTWMQNILLHLIFQDLKIRNIMDYSQWLEIRFRKFEDIQEVLNRQTKRRVIKSHIPFDGIRYEPNLKYVFVSRDPRDIFMSAWNFYRSFGDEFFEKPDDPRVEQLPRPPEDILEFWDTWISKGVFEDESDGYPFWSCLRQTQTWWDQRHRENIIIFHYSDMLRDLRGQIKRVADFVGIDVSDEMLEGITELCTFSSMKENAAAIDENSEKNLKGGAASFFNKGTNRRWEGILDAPRIAAYDAQAAKVMTPECRRWMENGGPTD